MDPQDLQKLKAFHNVLKQEEPVEPTSEVYVPYHAQHRDDGDPIEAIARRISFEEGQSVSLLSGLRGTGKSTELRRLRKLLEDEGCVVLLSDMREYVNPTEPVEITDFLVSMMGALAEAAALVIGSDPAKEKPWTRVANFLRNTEVKFTDLEGEPGGVGIKAALVTDPSFKRKVQDGLKTHVGRLIEESRKFAEEVVGRIRAERTVPGVKVVFLVDSLEHIVGVGPEATKIHDSLRNLFSGFGHALQLPLLHVVYTLPPYLPALVPGVGAALGGAIIEWLPSVHVQKRDGTPDAGGLEVMEKIVTKRFAAWKTIFAEAQLRELALASGGDLRDYFRLLKYCLGRAKVLPVEDSVVKAAKQALGEEMRPLTKEDKQWLAVIARAKKPELESLQKLPALARFFDSKAILNYRNGEQWYDVHPLLRDEVLEGATA